MLGDYIYYVHVNYMSERAVDNMNYKCNKQLQSNRF